MILLSFSGSRLALRGYFNYFVFDFLLFSHFQFFQEIEASFDVREPFWPGFGVIICIAVANIEDRLLVKFSGWPAFCVPLVVLPTMVLIHRIQILVSEER